MLKYNERMSRPVAHADVFQAIADPTRRQILTLLLTQDEPTATEIAAPFGVTLSAVSQHLRVLREADLVAVRRVGRERRYRLNADPLREVATWIHAYEQFWAERLTALGELLEAEAAADKEKKP
jgi:DNA-binding transcriptional ArsR family regulator